MEKNELDDFLSWEQSSRDTIDVKKCYIDIAGNLVAGVLLSQIIYWFLPNKNGKSKLRVLKDKEYCIAKNRSDWMNECRITPKQYDRAIKILESKGYLRIKNSMFNAKRTPHIFLMLENVRKDLILLFKNEKSVSTKGKDRCCSNDNTDVADW